MNLTAFTTGLGLWSIGEYALHRWILHGPGKKWHLAHHSDPLGDGFDWKPSLVAGVLAGFVAYSYIHWVLHHKHHPKGMADFHDTHHWRPIYNFGVTSKVWDKLFRTEYKGI